MGNVQPTTGQVDDRRKVIVHRRVPGFSYHNDDNVKEESDDEGERRRKRLKREPMEIRLGSLNVRSISRAKQHECRKSARVGYYTSKYNFKTKERKYLPKNMLGLKCLKRIHRHDRFNVFRGFLDKVSWHIMDHSLDVILQWIIQNKAILYERKMVKRASIRGISVDFVCMRGVLANIMQIPYLKLQRRKVWGIGAVKFGNTIYMVSLAPDGGLKSEHIRRLTYSGQKFSEYITNPAIRYTSDGLKDAVCYDFCCVYLNKSLKHNVLYAGKIDCIDRSTINRDLKDMKFKELEIMMVPDSSSEMVDRVLSQRARDMWTKAALSDIDQFVVGLRKRDQEKFVEKIQHFSTDYLLALDRNWSPHHCVNSLNDVLDKIREVVKEESVYHRIYFTDPNTISIVRTSYSIDTILPPWFIKEERPQI